MSVLTLVVALCEDVGSMILSLMVLMVVDGGIYCHICVLRKLLGIFKQSLM